ncbi:MAG TPA: ribose-phosphate diphosphokinase, partial [Coriobacteriia bacterium]
MSETSKRMMVFTGTANPELADGIAAHLGIELGKVKIRRFANGEIYVRYLESVRGADVFIVQSMSTPVNAALMELLIMTDAARRASARSITAVITHYGYARQDKKSAAREPITAKLVADLITVAGVDRVITMDLHQGQIQGF